MKANDSSYKETKERAILKSLSWRTLGTIITAIVAWKFTGKLDLSISIVSLDFFIKIFAYYVHERVWTGISFGYKQAPVLAERYSKNSSVVQDEIFEGDIGAYSGSSSTQNRKRLGQTHTLSRL